MGLPKTPEGIAAFKQKISALKKGTHISEDAKRKQSISIKKYYENPQHREESSKRTLKQWENQERRAAMSARMKKRYEDPEERRKTALESTGRKKSKETIEKMRVLGKKRWENPEVRIQASECKMGEKNPMFGKTPSEETRRKISESLKGRVVSEETRKKISEANMGKIAPHAGKTRPAWICEKISKAKKGVPFTQEHCKKLSDARIGRFCGPHSNNWKGGVSYEPYCPKFNKEFKERVRTFFGNVCVECGVQPTFEKLHVHHVGFNKDTCCDSSIPLFVPLCRSCHAKTQFNRDYWIERFTNLINSKYDGQCYFPKV